MKPEQFAPGEQVSPSLRIKVDVDNFQAVCQASPHAVDSSPVVKHMVDTRADTETLSHSHTVPPVAEAQRGPLYMRRQYSSSFLQPEQFFAELKIKTRTDLRPHLTEPSLETSSPQLRSPQSQKFFSPQSFNEKDNAKPRTPLSPQNELARENQDSSSLISVSTNQYCVTTSSFVASAESDQSSTPEKGEESFYECAQSLPPLELSSDSKPTQSLPTLELCFDGKPAPAPSYFRARRKENSFSGSTPLSDKLYRNIDTKSVQKFVDKNSVEPGESPGSVEAQGSPQLEKSSSQGSGRFFKASTPALLKLQATSALLGKSLSNTKSSNVREKLGRSFSDNKDPSRGLSSPGAGHSAETTLRTHSQPIKLPSDLERDDVQKISRLRRMFKWGASRKGYMAFLKSLEKKLGKKSSKARAAEELKEEGEAIVDAFRGVTSHGTAETTSSHEDQNVLNGSATFGLDKLSLAKLAAKHKRNSTWDAGKLCPDDHPFSPKNPQLATRDAHGLLTPPRRLTADSRDTEFQRRRGKPSMLNAQSRATNLSTTEATDNMPSLTNGRNHPTLLGDAPTTSKTPSAPKLQQSTITGDAPHNSITTNHRKSGQGTDSQPSQLGQVTPAMSSRGNSPSSPALNATPPGRAGTQVPARSPGQSGISPGRSESQTPSRSPRLNVSSPNGVGSGSSPGFHLPPLKLGSQSIPDSLEQYATSSGRAGFEISPRSSGLHVTSPGSAGSRTTPTPGRNDVSPGRVRQMSLGSRGLSAIERSTLEKDGFRLPVLSSGQPDSVKHTVFEGNQQEPRMRTRSRTAEGRIDANERVVNGQRPQASIITVSDESGSSDKSRKEGGNALPLSTSRPVQGVSFEQIVAGRNRSPPTDNTLMKFFFKCREIEHINKYLSLQKKQFLETSTSDFEKCFHMILSEAGAGVSSMIAAICTTWLLENTLASATASKWQPIPVMNMSQKDMWQHRDAAWLFHVCGIEASAILFLDEITPTNETIVAGRVKRAVIGQDILVTKDEVISSCTILAEKFRQEAPKLLQARYMRTLLLAGILLDTNNLLSASERDKEQATSLLVGAGSLGRNGFYNHLINIRDENYVTSFIKEIYGDSNPLAAERPTSIIRGDESIPSTVSHNDSKSERSLSWASKKVPGSISSPISPSLSLPQNASITPNSSLFRYLHSSKISLAFRRLRKHSSPQQ